MTRKVSKIEVSIRTVTGVARKPGELDADYLPRAARACNGLDETQWDSLSTPAQAWANDAIEAMAINQSPPDFKAPRKQVAEESTESAAQPTEQQAEAGTTDAPAEEQTEPSEQTEPAAPAEESAVKPKKKSTKVKADKPKIVKPKVVRPASGKKGIDAHNAFRQLVIDNPLADREKLYALAARKGIGLKPPSMGAVVYHTDQTIEMLRERGLTTLVVDRARKSTKAAKAAAADKPKKVKTKKPKSE